MKVLALVYPGMTLLDLVGPLQAWSFLPGYEVQYAWHRPGAVLTDCGLGVQATHSFEDAWTDPDALIVGGGAKPTLDLLGDAAAIAFLADRGSRARWVCSVCTGSLAAGGRRPAARLPCGGALGRAGSPGAIRRRAQQRARLRRSQPDHRGRHHGGCRLRYHGGGTLGGREHGARHRAHHGVRAAAAVWNGPSRSGRRADSGDGARGDATGDDRRAFVGHPGCAQRNPG